MNNRVENANNMLHSEQFSALFESQNYNMFGSQPLIMQRSCNYKDSNPSSNVLHNSISYGSSQENKSQKSRKHF